MDVKKLVRHLETIMSDYKDVKEHMTAAAGVIVKEEGGQKYILLIQRSSDDHWPNHFEFPRGKCDKPIGENVNHCALREIKEETGLDVEIIELIDTFEYLADGGKRHTKCFNYLCKMKDPNQKVKLSKEHKSFRWISQLGEAELMIMPDQVKTIEKVLSNDNSISTTPENSFTKNDMIEEYLKCLF